MHSFWCMRRVKIEENSYWHSNKAAAHWQNTSYYLRDSLQLVIGTILAHLSLCCQALYKWYPYQYYQYLPAKFSPHQNQNHQQHIGKYAQGGKAQEDSRLRLWVISASDVPGSVGVVLVAVVHVQGGLDPRQDDGLPLDIHGEVGEGYGSKVGRIFTSCSSEQNCTLK